MNTAPLILGIDPGGNTTALVLKQGPNCLDMQLIGKEKGQDPEDYALAVACHVNAALHDYREAGYPAPLVRVEKVVPPSPYVKDGRKTRKSMMHPKDLIGVTLTLGAILAELVTAGEHVDPLIVGIELVRPAKHGHTPRSLKPGKYLDRYMAQNYPAYCLPDKPGTAYQDRLRHARSAWDIAKTKGVPL